MNPAPHDLNTIPSSLSLRSLGGLAWSRERMALSRVKSQEHELKHLYVGTDCVELTPVDMKPSWLKQEAPLLAAGRKSLANDPKRRYAQRRGLPSQVKGDGFRAHSRRSSWVRIPPPAFSGKASSNLAPPGFFPFNVCPERLFFQCDDPAERDQPDVRDESERPDNPAA